MFLFAPERLEATGAHGRRVGSRAVSAWNKRPVRFQDADAAGIIFYIALDFRDLNVAFLAQAGFSKCCAINLAGYRERTKGRKEEWASWRMACLSILPEASRGNEPRVVHKRGRLYGASRC